MHCPDLPPKFLTFLEDYARRIGKDPDRIIEEAVSQAILRHEAAQTSSAHDGLLMPPEVQRTLRAALAGTPSEFGAAATADSPFGEFLEHLPDQNWTYQVGRLDEWWFLLVSKAPHPLPEPLELRSTETSQAYVWLFGFTKKVRLWTAPDRFMVVF